jgi:hypothetical protein
MESMELKGVTFSWRQLLNACNLYKNFSKPLIMALFPTRLSSQWEVDIQQNQPITNETLTMNKNQPIKKGDNYEKGLCK